MQRIHSWTRRVVGRRFVGVLTKEMGQPIVVDNRPGDAQAIIDKLNAGINRALASPALKEKFAFIGDELVGGPPELYAATIRKDSARWADVIKRSSAKID